MPFEVPRGADFDARLGSVLQVIYLVFNEGYSATSGDDWVRPALCEDALRLGRVLAGLVPDGPEVHGLVALMEIQASRFRARTGADGRPLPIPEQQRARWDRLLIDRGLAALARAESFEGPPGPYVLQAAIAACHARARTTDETDWPRIVALYDALAQVAPSPIVELNRAVAVSMAYGPAAGLELVDALASEPSLKAYHLLPAVRGDLLMRAGRFDEAAVGAGSCRLDDAQPPRAEPAAGASAGSRRGGAGRGREVAPVLSIDVHWAPPHPPSVFAVAGSVAGRRRTKTHCA